MRASSLTSAGDPEHALSQHPCQPLSATLKRRRYHWTHLIGIRLTDLLSPNGLVDIRLWDRCQRICPDLLALLVEHAYQAARSKTHSRPLEESSAYSTHTGTSTGICGFQCDLRLLRAAHSPRQPQRVSDALGRTPGEGSTRLRCRLLHTEWHLALVSMKTAVGSATVRNGYSGVHE